MYEREVARLFNLGLRDKYSLGVKCCVDKQRNTAEQYWSIEIEGRLERQFDDWGDVEKFVTDYVFDKTNVMKTEVATLTRDNKALCESLLSLGKIRLKSVDQSGIKFNLDLRNDGVWSITRNSDGVTVTDRNWEFIERWARENK